MLLCGKSSAATPVKDASSLSRIDAMSDAANILAQVDSAVGCYDPRMFQTFLPTPGHQNNFDVLRILAAALVILTHSWALTASEGEPIQALSQDVLLGGALGVWIFFFISGYLVSESFQNRGLLAFIEARFLRIYPAFFASLLFGVLIGAFVTTLPLAQYLTHEQTLRYVVSSLLTEIQFSLPGVFHELPVPDGINGSLWSIPLELVMYLGVVIAGVLTLLRRPNIALLVLLTAIITLQAEPNRVLLIPRVTDLYMLPTVLCFLLGMLFYTNRTRIPLHGFGVIFIVATLIISGLYFPKGNILVCFAIAYTTAWFAYHPRIRIKIPKRIGDISYGLYVYAFPIQLTVIYLVPGIRPWPLLALAFTVTAGVAWISWHTIEKPALGLKGKFIPARFSRTQPGPPVT
jgi:peptidoglycan/LPS O-acetylase OafA/YrhL